MLTVLLLIIFGIIDFGRLLFASQSMKAASREGARAAAVGAAWGPSGTLGTVQQVTSNSGAAGASLAGGTLVVTSTPAGSGTNPLCATAGGQVTVTATTDFRWFTPTGIFASSIDEVTSSTTMRCE